MPVANSPAPSVSPAYKSGELLVARIAKVKLLSDADSSADALGLLAKNEEVIYLGEARGAYLKVRGSDSEGWVDKALLAKP